MADFFLHTQLIEDIYKNHLEYNHIEYAKLGAQGPDPFYYVIKSKIHKQANQLADDMHDTRINEFLISMVNYAKEKQDPYLNAYIIGFMTHFILDVTIHPYIYYNVGEYFYDEPKTHKYRGYHLRFERSVDVAYIRYRYKKDAPSFHRRNRITPIKCTPDNIKALHDYVSKKVYDIDRGGDLYDSGYLTMRKLLNLLINDKLGFKKLFLSIADKFMSPSPIYLKDYPYHKKDKDYDYLNLGHGKWHHPITNKEMSLSVIDLYDQAYEEVEDVIAKVLSYIEGNDQIDLKEVFKNRSFNSGEDVSKGLRMIHFKLYDEK